uniref:F-box domain-containing protein n=1 Tax=Glossina brevipalpis TaxID=37001 RepID=A0A1A9W144_9MUSC
MDTLLNVPKSNTLLPALPNEVLIKIFSYLSHTGIQQIKLVCKNWYHLTHVPELKYKSKLVITKENIQDIYDFMESHKFHLEYLIYACVEVNEYRLDSLDFQFLVKILRKLGAHILKLKLRHQSTLSSINDYLPNLKELNLSLLLPEIRMCLDNLVNFSKFQSVESLLMPSVRSHPLLYKLLCSANAPFTHLKKLSVSISDEGLPVIFLETYASVLRWLKIKGGNRYDEVGEWDSQSLEVFTKYLQLEVLIITDSFFSGYNFLEIILTNLPQENRLKTIHLEERCDAELLELVIRKWSSSLEYLHWSGGGLYEDLSKQLSMLSGKLRYLCLVHTLGLTLDGIAPEKNTILTGLKLERICDRSHQDRLYLLLQRLPNLTALNLIFSGLKPDDRTLGYIFEHLVHLRILLLNRCCCESLGPKFTTNNLKRLHALVSCYCPIVAFSNFNSQFGELSKLGLLSCSREERRLASAPEQSREDFPALEQLSLNGFSMSKSQEIRKNFPRLNEEFVYFGLMGAFVENIWENYLFRYDLRE